MTDKTPPAPRRRKLIRPGIQLRVGGIICGVVVLALVMQSLLFALSLATTANEMPVGSDYLLDLIPRTLMQPLAMTLVVLLPLAVVVGVLSTFGMVGPVYRMEEHLRAVIRGEEPGPCHIRRSDAFQELCDLMNAALDLQKSAPADERVPEDESRAA